MSRRKAYKRFGSAKTLCLTGFIPGKQDKITGPRLTRRVRWVTSSR